MTGGGKSFPGTRCDTARVKAGNLVVMRIWNVWDARDPAITDTFFPTWKEASAAMKFYAEEDTEADMQYRVLDVPRLTKAYLCDCLTVWPHR